MKLYRNYIYLCLFFLGYIFLSCKSSPKVSLAQFTLKDSVEESITPNPYIARDRSPMDMSYWPSSYPILKMNNDDSIELLARLIYSRPQKRGRVIFGENGESLCAYGKEWRLGANEATEIDFFKPAIIAGNKINAGKYILYCKPYPDYWELIFNSNIYTWGLHIDSTKDILKISVPVIPQTPPLEEFTMIFKDTEGGTNLIMAWDSVKVILPIQPE